MRMVTKIVSMLFLMLVIVASANGAGMYPETLENGKYVLVDGGMGVGKYIDRTTVMVENYNPPYYQIAIKMVGLEFSDSYWREHETYIGSPYKEGYSDTVRFRYDWDKKIVSYERGNKWLDWDINHDYSHAEGAPFIPNAAEVAFVAAYNMRFFDQTMGYSPVLKRKVRVIDEELYRALGI